MMAAQQHTIVEFGLAAVGPVDHVMRIYVAIGGATRERTTAVAVLQCPTNGRCDVATAAADIQRLAQAALEFILHPVRHAALTGLAARGFCGNVSSLTKFLNPCMLFHTKAGEVDLKLPKPRCQTFETAIIERYKCRVTSIEEALMEMYLAWVSVRRVEDITEALWGTRVRSGTVNREVNPHFKPVRPARRYALTAYDAGA